MDKPEDGEEDKRGSSIGKNVETAGNTEYPAVFFDSLLDGLLNDQFANLRRCLPRILDNDIENGKVSPNLNQLEKIANALNLQIQDLYECI